jgi:hypothetical protein
MEIKFTKSVRAAVHAVMTQITKNYPGFCLPGEMFDKIVAARKRFADAQSARRLNFFKKNRLLAEVCVVKVNGCWIFDTIIFQDSTGRQNVWGRAEVYGKKKFPGFTGPAPRAARKKT